ncbi:MAG: GNAT family N-acetyltransferase [Caldilineaceae bacterium]
MLLLTPAQTAALQDWFLPERVGPLPGPHVIATGHGRCWVDRWPAPRAVLVEAGGNYSLLGDPNALAPADIQPHIKGFVDAPEAFTPLLHAAFPDVQVWLRVVFAPLAANVALPALVPGVRRLAIADTSALEGLGPDSAWIAKTWGGARGLAASGYGWGAFVDGELAAVACTFYLGRSYEDIGVVTLDTYRRRGLSTACTVGLCCDVRARGHQPLWETSPDNTASLRVAEKLGFQVDRQDVSYVIGVDIPT